MSGPDTGSFGVPCKPRMAGCAASCLHRQLVDEYRAARAADELAQEAATAMYAAERALYRPLVTFKSWLVATTGRYGQRAA